MKKWGIILALVVALIQNNCATTTLLKTELDYQPVSPVKLRLGCSADFPKEKFEPAITLNLITEKLHQKQEIKHYKTSYVWRNTLISLGFTGLCIGATINWWDYAVEDTSGVWYPGRVLGILGASFGVLSLFAANEKPFPPKYWHKTEAIATDTLFKDPQPLSKKPIVIKVLDEEKPHSFQTDEKGKVFIDIRDFNVPSLESRDLVLMIGYENLATKIAIPANYVKQVKDYEAEAKNLFTNAEAKEKKGKYEEALDDYKLIIEKYSLAKVSSEAEVKVTIMQNKIIEKKIAGITKKIQKVSDDKVRNTIAKLGLDEYQSNAFAIAIENLPSNTAATVMKDGLGMPLSDDECSAEYRKLTLYQKFYAVICYLRKCDKDLDKAYKAGEGISEENFWYQIAGKLNISEEIVYRLLNIKPENLLKK